MEQSFIEYSLGKMLFRLLFGFIRLVSQEVKPLLCVPVADSIK